METQINKILVYLLLVFNPVFTFANEGKEHNTLGFQLGVICLFALLLVLAVYYRIWKLRKSKLSDDNSRINSLPITRNGRAHFNSLNIGNRKRPSM